MYIQNFKELIVWQKSMTLTELIYTLTKKLPKEEVFGLSSQMRRCAVSIASNIAEGKSRGTKKDFKNFLRIAHGSSSELETQLEISRRVYGLKIQEETSLLLEIQKMLSVLIIRIV